MRACKDCNDRVVGCHAVCPRYAEENAQQEALREQRRLEQIGRAQAIERSLMKRDNAQSISRRRQGY